MKILWILELLLVDFNRFGLTNLLFVSTLGAAVIFDVLVFNDVGGDENDLFCE